MNKRPIDLMRESGGAFRIESDNDNSPIQDICELDNTLVLVTQNGVYEVKLADQIDPKRENPNLPHNIQRCILDIGADSSLVGKTLLTANALFKDKFLAPHINTEKTKSLVFEILVDLNSMNKMLEEFSTIEDKEIKSMEERLPKSGSLAIPSISDVNPRAKSFIQKADHIQQAIIDLICLFYPDISAGHFETIFNSIKDKYETNDDFVGFLKNILPFMTTLRDTRNCLDHRNAKAQNRKGAIIQNFTIDSNGAITPPTIEIDFRKTTFEAISLSYFMSIMINNLIDITEQLIAFLCSNNIRSIRNYTIQIAITPEAKRRNKSVQFGYYTNFTGQWVPMS